MDANSHLVYQLALANQREAWRMAEHGRLARQREANHREANPSRAHRAPRLGWAPLAGCVATLMLAAELVGHLVRGAEL